MKHTTKIFISLLMSIIVIAGILFVAYNFTMNSKGALESSIIYEEPSIQEVEKSNIIDADKEKQVGIHNDAPSNNELLKQELPEYKYPDPDHEQEVVKTRSVIPSGSVYIEGEEQKGGTNG